MFWGLIAATFLFLGVSLGAFAAHGLKGKLAADMLVVFETAVRYHMYHALALLAVANFAPRERAFVWAGDFYVAGIVLFSGSLYALAISGVKWLGAITPLGGLCFLLGHALLAVAFYRLGS